MSLENQDRSVNGASFPRDGHQPGRESVRPATSAQTKSYRGLAPEFPSPAEGPLGLRDLLGGDAERCPPAPVELEIGFGRGRFLIERAQVVPGHAVVGIEVKPKWAFRVHERCARMNLANVRVFCADARQVLERLQGQSMLDRVFVHFPDPWWKKRHAKRKVLSDPTLAALARLIKPSGELYVQTDVEERAQEFWGALQRVGGFQCQWLTHNPFGARSNREARADEDGLPVWRLLAIRDASNPGAC